MVLVLALALTSCSDDSGILGDLFSGETESVSVSDLPQAVVDAVGQALPGQEIISATMITSSDGTVLYSVETEEGEEMTCQRNGMTMTEIDAADLPQTIIDYLAAEYPESVILRAGLAENAEGESRYIVKLSSGQILAFDESGELVATRMRGEGRRGKHRHGDHGSFESIELTDLPQTIQDYLSTNHASDTIHKTFSLETREGDTVYGVKLDGHQVLFFDESGNLLEDFQPGWHR